MLVRQRREFLNVKHTQTRPSLRKLSCGLIVRIAFIMTILFIVWFHSFIFHSVLFIYIE